ncbi:MAG: phosphoheptose isomerase [Pyrinomonas sp.]|uniref:SIS domain-containing protein n=1 Tax=Pyrinomonas sp. TaxID=2080306 RepID=UPI003317F048
MKGTVPHCWIEERLLARNRVSQEFFPREASRLAEACCRMAERFLEGGRLLAFGRGPYATDAQHVSVEFLHPVIVGKRALPALDLSLSFGPWLETIVQPQDTAMGFGPPEGDDRVEEALRKAQDKGALTFALPGRRADYATAAPSDDPFIHQEMIEILYHTLWETVHVFFEHKEVTPHDAGEASFLYPFLGDRRRDLAPVTLEVASSILSKAREDERLRVEAAKTCAATLADCATAVAERLHRGGRIIAFGNGGSATDANDFALDCVTPPRRAMRPIPAVSLAMEPAVLTAVANDVGQELMFLRQLVAHARSEDVAFAISTSGGSKNIIVALEEARRRGMLTIGLLGYDGGEIVRRQLVDFALVVRCDYIPRIQEAQASLYHTLREALDQLLIE